MAMKLSCAFATSLQSHQHARIAEQLGYDCAWFYDSPPLYPDVWVQLCRAAELTSRIKLATGVLVPHLRHPMTTASAIGTLVSLAGEARVVVGIGSGFTACVSMGQRPLTWRYVTRYIETLRALLRGDEVEWEGGVIKMLHWQGYAPPRPIEVPFVIAAGGPKGMEVARTHGQGVFTPFAAVSGFSWSVALIMGTVLDEGEAPGTARAIDAAGHGAAVMFHYALEHRLLDSLEGGEAWKAVYDAVPESTRHLALHDGHLVGVNDRDRVFVTGDLLAKQGLSASRSAWRERLAALEADGATEIAYQPAGNDIPRELEAFARMMQG